MVVLDRLPLNAVIAATAREHGRGVLVRRGQGGSGLYGASAAGRADAGVGQRRRQYSGRGTRRLSGRGRENERQGGRAGRAQHPRLLAVGSGRSRDGVDHDAVRSGGDLPRRAAVSGLRRDRAPAVVALPHRRRPSQDRQPERAAASGIPARWSARPVSPTWRATPSSAPRSATATGWSSCRCTAQATCTARRSACWIGASASTANRSGLTQPLHERPEPLRMIGPCPPGHQLPSTTSGASTNVPPAVSTSTASAVPELRRPSVAGGPSMSGP